MRLRLTIMPLAKSVQLSMSCAKELQGEVNRLCSTQENEKEIGRLFSEMLQSQGPQTSTVVEMQVNSEPHQVVNQGSLEHEGWKIFSAHTRRRASPFLKT